MVVRYLVVPCYLSLFLTLCALFSSGKAHAQNASLDAGLRFQQTLDLYNENGVTVQFASPGLLKNHLQVGANYVSSRLGSALWGNAIKQDHIFINGSYVFRPEKIFRPIVTLNAGWFQADYESPIFDDLPQSSATVALEAGISIKTNLPVKFGVALGYNLITGDGATGPGTLYPVYGQFNITCNLLKRRAK